MAELSDHELNLYSRQILLDGWDLAAQQQLKDSCVLIVGAGGIGCCSAELLARAGVANIHIVDFDVIELSNLQRQLAFLPEHVGLSKVEQLVNRLQQINPNIAVTGYPHKVDAHFLQTMPINTFDLVLDGCDNFATRYLVNQFCLSHQIPLLSAAAIGLQGQLTFLTGQPCYHCLFPDNESSDERRCASSGVLATTPVHMASLQAHHALLYLGLRQAPLHNKLLIWNGETMQTKILSIISDDTCKCCHLKGLQHNLQ